MATRVQFDPYVLGLITGKTVKVKQPNGKFIEQYTPFTVNKYLPLGLLMKMNNTISKQELFEKEDVFLKPLVIDRKCFQKDSVEKLHLKTIKKAHKAELLKAGKNTKKHMNVHSA